MISKDTHELLLNDRFAPITSEIGFVEADSRVVVDTWLQAPPPALAELRIEAVQREVQGNLPTLLSMLPPLTAGGTTKYLFVPTLGPWTALFDNGWRGPDVTSIVSVLAGRLQCHGLRVVAIPNTICERELPHRGRYGAVILEIYGPECEMTWALPPSPQAGKLIALGGKLARAIVALNDGGRWIFRLEGDPLSYEHPDRYRATRIKDRFTVEMLRDYLAALGIRAFNADFYAPSRRALLVELEGAEHYVSRKYTLAQARTHF